MSIRSRKWEEIVQKDYLCEKSILHIGALENNKYNIEAFQKQFKSFDSSLNKEYILGNFHKYDIIFYIHNENTEILREIRNINTQIPIIVYNDEGSLQTMKYIKYNIAHFVSSKNPTLEIILLFQYEMKHCDNLKRNLYLEKEQEQYLNILDDFIIISRTDLKGKITYVNDIFCEISGYNKDELLGAPHNIVRHPDMPKEAFKKMWQTIKEDNIWTDVVKNRAKNGETYIAKSTIMPYYVDEVKVGYIGLRYVITDEITEKSAIKAYLTKTVVKFKMELKEKNDLIKRHFKEIELLKKHSNNDDYYIGWQRELKKKEKLQEQVNRYEDKIKDIEGLYQKRIDKFLLEKRENDEVITKKNNQIKTLTDEKKTLNEQIDSFKLDIEEKLSYIEELQKRNQELEDILTHKEEQIQKLK